MMMWNPRVHPISLLLITFNFNTDCQVTDILKFLDTIRLVDTPNTGTNTPEIFYMWWSTDHM